MQTPKSIRLQIRATISHISQTFVKSSDTDFVEKATKTEEKVIKLSADIFLCKLSNKHIKNLFCDVGQSWPSETTCRRTVLEFSEDELQRIRNAIHDKQIFLVVDESILSGTLYLNILFGTLETPHVSYLYDCQPQTCGPNSNSIAQAVDDAVRTLRANRKSFYLWLSDAAKYNVAAGALLKSLYRKPFHVTCYEKQISYPRCWLANCKCEISNC